MSRRYINKTELIDNSKKTGESTHIVLMQYLKYSVDIIERMYSGGASLFGLTRTKHSVNKKANCSLANHIAAGI